METLVQLLTLCLTVVVIFQTVSRRRAEQPRVQPAVPSIEVSDPAMARRMLIDHADAFTHRPVSPFPVEFVTGPRVNLSHSISTVPHGPLWRNRTAGVLHPSRLGLLAPLQREAVGGLAAAFTAAARSGATGVDVVVRDTLHTAVLTLMLRLCFGDGGVDARGVRAVQRVLRDFNVLMVDAGELARSRSGPTLSRFARFLLPRSHGSSPFKIAALPDAAAGPRPPPPAAPSATLPRPRQRPPPPLARATRLRRTAEHPAASAAAHPVPAPAAPAPAPFSGGAPACVSATPPQPRPFPLRPSSSPPARYCIAPAYSRFSSAISNLGEMLSHLVPQVSFRAAS
ncbi:hypothetical protein EJB05_28280, partial [Eragrostis curvula]